MRTIGGGSDGAGEAGPNEGRIGLSAWEHGWMRLYGGGLFAGF